MAESGDRTRKRPQPEQNQAPVVQRVRIRYAKRGPMRFTSHRDFARALERAILRANLPIAYSQGFTPHPKISYASAAPTGAASEAEYLEIGLREPVDPAEVARVLNAALSPGLDVVDAWEAPAAGSGSLPDRIDAASWRLELPGVEPDELRVAVAAFLAAAEVPVQRLTKQGLRTMDARGPVVLLRVVSGAVEAPNDTPTELYALPCAILDLVVRQVTPSVRPDDVLSGLRVMASLVLSVPPRATRLAQGALTEQGAIVDPHTVDRDGAVSGAPSP